MWTHTKNPPMLLKKSGCIYWVLPLEGHGVFGRSTMCWIGHLIISNSASPSYVALLSSCHRCKTRGSERGTQAVPETGFNPGLIPEVVPCCCLSTHQNEILATRGTEGTSKQGRGLKGAFSPRTLLLLRVQVYVLL